MKHKKKAIAEKILFNKAAYYSYLISTEILRVAKIEADKSHQAALRAKALYDAQHGRS